MGVPNELNAAYGGGSGSGPPLPVPLRSNAGRYLNHSLIGAGPYLDLKPIVPSQFTPHTLNTPLKSVDANDIAEAAALPLATPTTSAAFVPSATALSLCDAATPTPSLLSLGSSHPDDGLRSYDLFLDFHLDELAVKNTENNTKNDFDGYHDKAHNPRLVMCSRPNTPNSILGPLSLDTTPGQTESYRSARSRSKSPGISPTRLRLQSRLKSISPEDHRSPRWPGHRPVSVPRSCSPSSSPLGSRPQSSASNLFPRLLGSLVNFPHLLEGATPTRSMLQHPCPIHEPHKLRSLREDELKMSGRLRRSDNPRGSWMLLPNVAEEGSSSGNETGNADESSQNAKSLFSDVSQQMANRSGFGAIPPSTGKTAPADPPCPIHDTATDASSTKFESTNASTNWGAPAKAMDEISDPWDGGVGLRFQELENAAQREEESQKQVNRWNSYILESNSVSNHQDPPSVFPLAQERLEMSHSRSEGNYSSKKTKSSLLFEQKVRRLEKLLQGTYYEGAVIRPDPEMLYFTSSEETMDSSIDSDSSYSEGSNQRKKKASAMCNTDWVMPALTQPSPLDTRWSRGTPMEKDSGDIGVALQNSSYLKEEYVQRPGTRTSSQESERTWDLREVEEAKEVLQRLHDWLSANLQQQQTQHKEVEGQPNKSDSWNSSLIREAVNFVHQERPCTAVPPADGSDPSSPLPLSPFHGERPGTPRGDEADPQRDAGAAPLREEVRPCTPSGDEARPFPRPLLLRAQEIRMRSASAKDSVWPTSVSPKREPEAERVVENRIALTKARMAALRKGDEEDDDDEDGRENKEEREDDTADSWDPMPTLRRGAQKARQVASAAAERLKRGFRVMQNVFAKCFFPSRYMAARREEQRNKHRNAVGGGASSPGNRRSSQIGSDSEGTNSLQSDQDSATDASGADASSGGGGGTGGGTGGGGNVAGGQPPGTPSSPICRICHSGPHSVPGLGPLLAPCRCRGTVALIHKTCLEHWLTEVGSDHCELCGFRFRTTYEPHMSLAYALLLWIKSGLDFRQMIQDLVWLSVMTPMAGMAAYTALNTARLLAVGPRAAQASAPWLLAGLFVSCSITLVAYYGWVLGAVHHYTNVWRSWWRRNFSVRVLFEPEETTNVGGDGAVVEAGGGGGGGGGVTGSNADLNPAESPGSERLLKVHADGE